MAGPYRESEASSIDCPRCTRALPPGTLTGCVARCGIWVSATIATDVFVAAELAPSRLTTWFRELTACPHCSVVMTLRGYDMSLFMGCEAHGYWVDDETVGQTGLGRASVAPMVKRARAEADALKAEREKQAQLAREKARTKEAALAAAVEAAQRAADERAAAARFERAQHEAALGPYLEVVRALSRDGDPRPMARKLQELDLVIAALTKRLQELEDRSQITTEQ